MRLTTAIETWPLRSVFRISRRETMDTQVVLVTVQADGYQGRGEAGPIARYGETPESVAAQIEALGLDRDPGPEALQDQLPPGAARNALDCALWDLRAKQAGQRVWELMGLPAPKPVETAFTLSIDTPDVMLEAAEAAAHRPVLKLKLAGDEHDLTRVRVVRAAAQRSKIIVDANEALDLEGLAFLAPRLAALGVDVIEQPLPAGEDEALRGFKSPVPLCADESAHSSRDLPGLIGKYDLINIKLDKTGGLTEALRLAAKAHQAGMGLMVGCMLGTSLAMAPALMLAQLASWVDLDGPLLLAKDREQPLPIRDSLIGAPPAALWG